MKDNFVTDISRMLQKSGIINGSFSRKTTTIKNKDCDYLENRLKGSKPFNFCASFENSFCSQEEKPNIILSFTYFLDERNLEDDFFEMGIMFQKINEKTFKFLRKQRTSEFPLVEDISWLLFDRYILDSQFSRGDYKNGYINLRSKPSEIFSVSSEVYGKDAYIYLSFKKEINQRKAEEVLKEKNIKFDVVGSRLDIQVDYYKGWHWDE